MATIKKPIKENKELRQVRTYWETQIAALNEELKQINKRTNALMRFA